MSATPSCAYCGDLTAPGKSLCLTCLSAIDIRYIDQNQVIVDAYVDACVAQFAVLLAEQPPPTV